MCVCIIYIYTQTHTHTHTHTHIHPYIHTYIYIGSKDWSTLEQHNYDRSKGKVTIEWFIGGETNLCHNAIDRHVAAGNGSQVAFHWEGNDEGGLVQLLVVAKTVASGVSLGGQ